MRRALLFLAALVLASCAAGSSSQCDTCYSGVTVYVYDPRGFALDVERFIDKDYGVVCYVYDAYGISCLSLAETELEP